MLRNHVNSTACYGNAAFNRAYRSWRKRLIDDLSALDSEGLLDAILEPIFRRQQQKKFQLPASLSARKHVVLRTTNIADDPDFAQIKARVENVRQQVINKEVAIRLRLSARAPNGKLWSDCERNDLLVMGSQFVRLSNELREGETLGSHFSTQTSLDAFLGAKAQ